MANSGHIVLLLLACLAVASADICSPGATQCNLPSCAAIPKCLSRYTKVDDKCCYMGKAPCYTPTPPPSKSDACPVEPFCGYTADELVRLTANPEVYDPAKMPTSGYKCPGCPTCTYGSTYALAVAGPKTCASALSALRATSVSALDFKEAVSNYAFTIKKNAAGQCKVYSAYYDTNNVVHYAGPLSVVDASFVTAATNALARAVARVCLAYNVKACVGTSICPNSACFSNGFAYASQEAYVSAVARAVADAYQANVVEVDEECAGQFQPSLEVDATATAASVQAALLVSGSHEFWSANTAGCNSDSVPKLTETAIAKALACALTRTYAAVIDAFEEPETRSCACSFVVALDNDASVQCPGTCNSDSNRCAVGCPWYYGCP